VTRKSKREEGLAPEKEKRREGIRLSSPNDNIYLSNKEQNTLKGSEEKTEPSVRDSRRLPKQINGRRA